MYRVKLSCVVFKSFCDIGTGIKMGMSDFMDLPCRFKRSCSTTFACDLSFCALYVATICIANAFGLIAFFCRFGGAPLNSFLSEETRQPFSDLQFPESFYTVSRYCETSQV